MFLSCDEGMSKKRANNGEEERKVVPKRDPGFQGLVILNDQGLSMWALKTGPVAEYIGKLDAGGRRSLVLLSCSLFSLEKPRW